MNEIEVGLKIAELGRDMDAVVLRVQKLVDDDHAKSVQLARMEAIPDVLARIEQKVDDGFNKMNGRVRTLETAAAVLRWAVGLVGVGAASGWGIALDKLFG